MSIETIKALLAKVSPGPWSCATDAIWHPAPDEDSPLAELLDAEDADGEFIASARTDVPLLLAVAEAAKALAAVDGPDRTWSERKGNVERLAVAIAALDVSP